MNRTLERKLGADRVAVLELLYESRLDDTLYNQTLEAIVKTVDMYPDVEALELDFTHYQLIRPKNRILARIQDETIGSSEVSDFELILRSAQMPMTIEERRNYIDGVVQKQRYESREELWSRYEQWQRQRLENGN